jgi:hypothetical protein
MLYVPPGQKERIKWEISVQLNELADVVYSSVVHSGIALAQLFFRLLNTQVKLSTLLRGNRE